MKKKKMEEKIPDSVDWEDLYPTPKYADEWKDPSQGHTFEKF